MSDGRSRPRAGVYAAIGTVAVAGGLCVAGAAGADGAANARAANADIYARDNGLCFSTVASAPACETGETADVEIETGDTVTWHFDGGAAQNHNAQDATDLTNPAWKVPASGFVNTGAYPYRFTQPGVYEFVCLAHLTTMTGTVTVTGDPIPTETPSPSPSPTPSATPTPSPTPSPGGGAHVVTPRPGGSADATRPTVGRVRTKALRRAVRVRFTLSEPATVTVRVTRRGSRKVLKSARVQAGAGTRAVTLRSKRLKKGRYMVRLQARDASGNRSLMITKRLRLRR
jgi:plastocyanin